MTKQELRKMVEMYAIAFGFKVKDSKWNACGFEIYDEAHTVNFTITEKHDDIDFENRTASATISVSTSIATMGGNNTADEIMRMGKTIFKAGELIKTIERFKEMHGDKMFQYTVEF